MLLADILTTNDIIIKRGVMYSSFFDGVCVEMHSKNKIKDGVMLADRSRRKWAKGSIQDYVKKYTISSVIPKMVNRVDHNLERASKLPNMKMLINSYLKDLEMCTINPMIYFMASLGKWYIFGSFGAIEGDYDGECDLVVDIDFIRKFCNGPSWLVCSDTHYGITYADLSFKYVLYRERHPGDVVLTASESKTIHLINTIMNAESIGRMKIGEIMVKIQSCSYGMIYTNRNVKLYKFSSAIEI